MATTKYWTVPTTLAPGAECKKFFKTQQWLTSLREKGIRRYYSYLACSACSTHRVLCTLPHVTIVLTTSYRHQYGSHCITQNMKHISASVYSNTVTCTVILNFMCGPNTISFLRQWIPELEKNARRKKRKERVKKKKMVWVERRRCTAYGNCPFWSDRHPANGDHTAWPVTQQAWTLRRFERQIGGVSIPSFVLKTHTRKRRNTQQSD
jgi:hypothetical protein